MPTRNPDDCVDLVIGEDDLRQVKDCIEEALHLDGFYVFVEYLFILIEDCAWLLGRLLDSHLYVGDTILEG